MSKIDDIKSANLLSAILNHYGYVCTEKNRSESRNRMMAQVSPEGKIDASSMKWVRPNAGAKGEDVWTFSKSGGYSTNPVVSDHGQKSVIDLVMIHENFTTVGQAVSHIEKNWNYFKSNAPKEKNSIPTKESITPTLTQEQKNKLFAFSPLDGDSLSYLRVRKINPETAKNPIFLNRFGGKEHQFSPTSRVTNFAIPFFDINGNLNGLETRYVTAKMEQQKFSLTGTNKLDSVWHSNVPSLVEKIMINEAPLDHVAWFELQKMKTGKNPSNTLFISTLGTPLPNQIKIIENFCKNHPKAAIILANDNDLVGNSFNITLMGSIKKDSFLPFEITSKIDKHTGHHLLKISQNNFQKEINKGDFKTVQEFAQGLKESLNLPYKINSVYQENVWDHSTQKENNYQSITLEGTTDLTLIQRIASELARGNPYLPNRYSFEKPVEKDFLVDLQLFKEFNQKISKPNSISF